MSTLALLNKDGTFRKKLKFTTLPPDYVVPENAVVSWRMEILASSMDCIAEFRTKEPLEANFYFGSAWGQIEKIRLPDDRKSLHGYNRRAFIITIQGTIAPS
jgi:hypothetical protein